MRRFRSRSRSRASTLVDRIVEFEEDKRIVGINPKTELRLNDAGVFHFWQLADLDADHSAALDRMLRLRGQIAKEDWVAQAKKLVEAAAV